MARVFHILTKEQLASEDQWQFDEMMKTRSSSPGPNSVLLYICRYALGLTRDTRVDQKLFDRLLQAAWYPLAHRSHNVGRSLSDALDNRWRVRFGSTTRHRATARRGS
jgi:hypothetical protein